MNEKKLCKIPKSSVKEEKKLQLQGIEPISIEKGKIVTAVDQAHPFHH